MTERWLSDGLKDLANESRAPGSISAELRHRIRLRRLVILASTTLALMAVTSSLIAYWGWEDGRDIAPAGPRKVVVTSDDPSLPEGCSVSEIASSMVGFFDALATGDPSAIEERFAKGNIFRSVGIGPPHGFTGSATIVREKALEYFTSRQGANESYELSQVSVSHEIGGASAGGSGIVRVDLLTRREAEDIDAGGIPFRGYAELDCPTRDIYLLNLGLLSPSEDINWCSSEGKENVVTACAARRN